VLLNYMGWIRKQPAAKRTHGNPERTLADKVGDVRIFLKEFGVTKLLKKNEEPKYHKKKVIAHPDDELDVLMAPPTPRKLFCSTSSSAAWRATTKPTGSTVILTRRAQP
jgi:hypothetical protein